MLLVIWYDAGRDKAIQETMYEYAASMCQLTEAEWRIYVLVYWVIIGSENRVDTKQSS